MCEKKQTSAWQVRIKGRKEARPKKEKKKRKHGSSRARYGKVKHTRVFISEATYGRDVVPDILAEATVVDVAHVDVLNLLQAEIVVKLEIVEGNLQQTIYPTEEPAVMDLREQRNLGQVVGSGACSLLVFIVAGERKGEEADAWAGGRDGDVWEGGSARVAEDTSRRTRSWVGIVGARSDEGEVAHVFLALGARQSECFVL